MLADELASSEDTNSYPHVYIARVFSNSDQAPQKHAGDSLDARQ